MADYNIHPVEGKIILMLLAFGVIWFLLIVPVLVDNNDWFVAMNPLEQYLVVNIGAVFLLAGLVSLLFKRQNTAATIKNGIAAFLLFSFIFDMWMGPFMYDWNGNILIQNAAALPGTAVDRVAGWLWGDIGGIHGNALYLSVYLLTPLIAAIIAAYLLKPKEFISVVSRVH